jgi:hypothetical protein
MSFRDPEGSGLVTIYHLWESGTDNSPRWDGALETVEVGEMAPYVRRDLQHVEDASRRPTDAEYDRYLWLVETIKWMGCERRAFGSCPAFSPAVRLPAMNGPTQLRIGPLSRDCTECVVQ